MHDSSASSQDRWLPVWSPESPFQERHESNYRSACAWSKSITKDFQASQEAVNDAFIVLHERMKRDDEMSPLQFKVVVRNKSIDALRRQIRRRKIYDDPKIIPFLEESENETPRPPDQVAERNDTATLKAALVETMRFLFIQIVH